YPDSQDLSLYHHTGKKYVSVKPNHRGRCAIPELELEVGLLDEWVRYWHKGKLLPLPADFQRELDETKLALERERQLLAREKKRGDGLEKRVERQERELAELRALVQRHSN